MRNGLLGSIAALVTGATLAFGQVPAGPTGPAGPAASALTPNPLEPVPMGPSTMGTSPAMSEPIGFMAGPDGYSAGPSEPQLNAERASAQLDYLLWWLKPWGPVYPLVSVGTTGPSGALTGPGSSTIVGPGNFELNPFSGLRFTLDYWCCSDRRVGLEFSGFVLEQRSQHIIFGFGDQVVARPVIDANTGIPQSELVAFPGKFTGGLQVSALSQLWGYEANIKFKLWCDECRSLTLLAGFRYMDLAERLDIQQRTTLLPGNTVFFYGLLFAAPAEIDIADTFQTRNQYYFQQIGLQGEWRFHRWVASWSWKFNYGVDRQTEVVNGNSTLILNPNTPNAIASTVPGGLLALTSNIGRRHHNEFAVMPEGAFQLGYRLLRSTDLVIGYQFGYLSRSIRPGHQFSPAISPTLLPTSAMFSSPGGVFSPAPIFAQSDMWVQGVNFGVHVHF
jgi:hypothetical protein